MKYDYKQTLVKMAKYFVIFILPFLATMFIENFPEIANISIGVLLVGLVNFLKVKVGVKLP